MKKSSTPRIRQYGTAGDRWLIQHGDIWRIGPHVLACGDLELDMAQPLLDLYGPVDFCLTDPPYTQAMATQYRRKMADMKSVHFSNLIQKVIDAARRANCGSWIEVGRTSTDLWKSLIKQSSGMLLGSYEAVYYGKHPCTMLYAIWKNEQNEGNLSRQSPRMVPSSSFPHQCNDTEVFAWVVEYFTEPGDLICDPCIGQGLTARLAHQTGRRVLGMELNPRRLAVTLDWLAQQPGIGKARKVGVLPSNPERDYS